MCLHIARRDDLDFPRVASQQQRSSLIQAHRLPMPASARGHERHPLARVRLLAVHASRASSNGWSASGPVPAAAPPACPRGDKAASSPGKPMLRFRAHSGEKSASVCRTLRPIPTTAKSSRRPFGSVSISSPASFLPRSTRSLGHLMARLDAAQRLDRVDRRHAAQDRQPPAVRHLEIGP